jgi:putative transposase
MPLSQKPAPPLRLLEPIGNIPPAEAEERYYAMLEEPAMAA